MRTFITGDLHQEIGRLIGFADRMELKQDDIIIVLGETCVNMGHASPSERRKNERVRMLLDQYLPCTLFSIYGNHEERASLVPGYERVNVFGAPAMVHPKYPRQVFALDGEVYSLPAAGVFRSVFVMGGAYSPDKAYRLANKLPWFPAEQPSEAIRRHGLETLEKRGWNVDIVLTHTCPLSMLPTEFFIPGLDQSKVDHSTEAYLEEIYRKLQFKRWYCGHFHGEKTEGKLTFLYKSMLQFDSHP